MLVMTVSSLPSLVDLLDVLHAAGAPGLDRDVADHDQLRISHRSAGPMHSAIVPTADIQVALIPVSDLLLFAENLFVCACRRVEIEQWHRFDRDCGSGLVFNRDGARGPFAPSYRAPREAPACRLRPFLSELD